MEKNVHRDMSKQINSWCWGKKIQHKDKGCNFIFYLTYLLGKCKVYTNKSLQKVDEGCSTGFQMSHVRVKSAARGLIKIIRLG